MQPLSRLARFALLALIAATAGPAGAADRSGLQEYGVQIGMGQSARADTQIIPLMGHAAWLLPPAIDEPIAAVDLNLKWVVEGWVAGVRNPTDSIEFGINPIGFKLEYDAGQAIVPYFQAGAGVLYTSLQGIDLGGPFLFNETIALGVEIFTSDRIAIDLSGRYRHASNAGLKRDNAGLDTFYGLIGISWMPKREP